ncbi:MAG: hypothetical protein ACRCZF_04290, partial [Gemmataceae bacterium]
KLFKQVKLTTPRSGGGYWIAPHWWFIESVQWEEPPGKSSSDADQLRPLGPTFEEAFGPRVRQTLYQVLRSTQVDLIYIEDGVRYSATEKVLRTLFDVYDRSAGQRPVADTHFQGVPRVRVMIHDYAPGKPFVAPQSYPEPKFDDVSRFRVLHVFKDRGDAVEDVDSPFDFSWEPAPYALI